MAKRKPQRRPQPRPRAGGPAPAQPRPFLTPDASPLRQAVERRSAVVVLFLRGLPKAMPGLLVLGLLAGALVAPGALGAVLVGLVALLLTWLVYLSWPALPQAGRLIRLAVIGGLLAVAASRVT